MNRFSEQGVFKNFEGASLCFCYHKNLFPGEKELAFRSRWSQKVAAAIKT